MFMEIKKTTIVLIAELYLTKQIDLKVQIYVLGWFNKIWEINLKPIGLKINYNYTMELEYEEEFKNNVIRKIKKHIEDNLCNETYTIFFLLEFSF